MFNSFCTNLFSQKPYKVVKVAISQRENFQSGRKCGLDSTIICGWSSAVFEFCVHQVAKQI